MASLKDHLFHFHPNGYQNKIPLRTRKHIKKNQFQLGPRTIGVRGLIIVFRAHMEGARVSKHHKIRKRFPSEIKLAKSTLSAGIQRVEIHRKCELSSGFRGGAQII